MDKRAFLASGLPKDGISHSMLGHPMVVAIIRNRQPRVAALGKPVRPFALRTCTLVIVWFLFKSDMSLSYLNTSNTHTHTEREREARGVEYQPSNKFLNMPEIFLVFFPSLTIVFPGSKRSPLYESGHVCVTSSFQVLVLDLRQVPN